MDVMCIQLALRSLPGFSLSHIFKEFGLLREFGGPRSRVPFCFSMFSFRPTLFCGCKDSRFLFPSSSVPRGSGQQPNLVVAFSVMFGAFWSWMRARLCEQCETSDFVPSFHQLLLRVCDVFISSSDVAGEANSVHCSWLRSASKRTPCFYSMSSVLRSPVLVGCLAKSSPLIRTVLVLMSVEDAQKKTGAVRNHVVAICIL